MLDCEKLISEIVFVSSKNLYKMEINPSAVCSFFFVYDMHETMTFTLIVLNEMGIIIDGANQF